MLRSKIGSLTLNVPEEEEYSTTTTEKNVLSMDIVKASAK